MSDTPRCNELINKHGFSTTRNGDKAVLVSDYRFSEDAFALARQLERELADKDRQLAEARAEIENQKWQKAKCAKNKTPRTDEQILHHDNGNGHPSAFVFASFARELEEELTEARARIDNLERIVNEMTEEQAALCAEDQSITELVAAKDKQLAEAQAEIENLKWHINSEKAKAEAALALNDRALELVNEAQADAEHWKSECNALQRMVHEARAEIKMKNEELDMFLAEQQAMGEIIERKDKLIEQMREALKAIDAIGSEKGDASRDDALRCFSIAKAALAAERIRP